MRQGNAFTLSISFFFLLAVAFLASMPSSPGAAATSLIDTIEAAFVYNPELKVSQENQQQAAHAIDKARAGYFPTVAGVAGAGFSQTSDATTRAYNDDDDFKSMADASVRLTQPLWHGGATIAEVAARKAEFAAADSLLEEKGVSLAYEAIVAHIEVLRRQEMLKYAQENVFQHKEILSTVRQRYENKVSTVGELHQVESRFSRAKATQSSYEAALDAARASYLKVTGRPEQELVYPHEPAKRYDNLESVRLECLEGSQRIKAAMAEVQATQGERGMAQSNFFPKFDLELGPSWYDKDYRHYNARTENMEGAVRMRWEFFSGGADLATLRMSKAKIRQARQNLHALMNSLNEDIESTFSRYRSAEVQIKEYASSKRSSRLAKEDYYRQFLSAQRSLIDVLDAENDYFYAAAQEALVKGDRVIAGYRLLALGGALLRELHIAPARLRPKQPSIFADDMAEPNVGFSSPLSQFTSGAKTLKP